MERFEDIVERYMQFDKKTLAELLALKEIEKNENDLSVKPGTDPGVIQKQPNYYPYAVPYPYRIPDYGYQTYPGDWQITCHYSTTSSTDKILMNG